MRHFRADPVQERQVLDTPTATPPEQSPRARCTSQVLMLDVMLAAVEVGAGRRWFLRRGGVEGQGEVGEYIRLNDERHDAGRALQIIRKQETRNHYSLRISSVYIHAHSGSANFGANKRSV